MLYECKIRPIHTNLPSSFCMLPTSDYRYYSLCKGIQSQFSNNYHIQFPVYCLPNGSWSTRSHAPESKQWAGIQMYLASAHVSAAPDAKNQSLDKASH